ncbi:MAG: response regulator [bacterium]
MVPLAKRRLLNVLIVDDEDAFRLSIEMALKITKEFITHSVDCGESAIAELKKEQFDVILLDYMMPDMSGIEVLRWLQEQLIQTPVIMITGAGSEAVAMEALKLGVYDYIRKDQLDIDRLAFVIHSSYERFLLRKKSIKQEAREQLLKEKQKEIDALEELFETVSSVGLLVDKSISDVSRNLKSYEEKIQSAISQEGKELLGEVFGQLKYDIEVIGSGVNSIRNLSNIITKKLDEISLAPIPEEDQANR